MHLAVIALTRLLPRKHSTGSQTALRKEVLMNAEEFLAGSGLMTMRRHRGGSRKMGDWLSGQCFPHEQPALGFWVFRQRQLVEPSLKGPRQG
ncbi:hypothetical protein NDU88_002324 [Pleurodeles waltl]|uniref:Uncharacterized protein n=1 Tax=Pleurodeles waltl TaxID=8319 RepID=A0AAV7U9D2_PLEWA|nr:hypothetical protein NDU88_002324 [Pleurodeles waltl]